MNSTMAKRTIYSECHHQNKKGDRKKLQNKKEKK